MAIRVNRGEAVTPQGDVVSVSALNTAADDVLRAAAGAEQHGHIVVSTSTIDSVIASAEPARVRNDHDESS